jgi:hypothetical protein
MKEADIKEADMQEKLIKGAWMSNPAIRSRVNGAGIKRALMKGLQKKGALRRRK